MGRYRKGTLEIEKHLATTWGIKTYDNRSIMDIIKEQIYEGNIDKNKNGVWYKTNGRYKSKRA